MPSNLGTSSRAPGAAVTPLAIVVVAGDRRQRRDTISELCRLARPGDRVLFDDGTALRERRAGPGGSSARLETVTPRRDEAVVFLDARVSLSREALEVLRELVALPEPLAVAPRSNVADGDELLAGVPYRAGDGRALAAYLHDVRDLAPAATSAEILIGPVLALSAAAAETLGGTVELARGAYDPGRWSREIAARGGRLLVAEGAHAHHPGGRRSWRDPREAGRPFISACLIVKDEEENLARCLGSLEGIADELVVYDTGSTDATRELAASLGARVIEGYWDDDFSRARNAALEHCRGQWVLWLDADEALHLDEGVDLHAYLDERLSVVEGFIVLIDNLRGHETSNVLTHPACRLFRRAYGRWDGAVHEQIVARAGAALDLVLALFESGRISHWGYLQQAVSGRNKIERNLRTAFTDLAAGADVELPMRLCSLGRSYALAGRYPEGADLCRLAADLAERPATRRLALRGLIESLSALERWDEALEEIGRLRRACTIESLPNLLEGYARLGRGELEAAEACLRAVGHGIDDDGFEYGDELVAAPLAETLFRQGRYGEAAATLLRVLSAGGGLDAHLGMLIDAVEHDGSDLGRIADAIGAARVGAYVPQLLQLQASVADRVLEAFLHAFPDERSLLAAGAKVARGLPIERRLVWSARLRKAGLPFACPLVAAALDESEAPADRAVSAATAVVAFADARAHHALVACLAGAGADERAAIDPALGALSGDLVELCRGVPPRPAPAHPSPAPGTGTGRRSLVVDDRPARLRAGALAARLAEGGRLVTLVAPLPVAGLAGLLNPRAVEVYGFLRGVDAEASRQAAFHVLARLAAGQRFDEVVLLGGARAWTGRLRNLLPAASVVHDADLAPEPPADGDAVPDLVLLGEGGAVPAEPGGTRSVVFPASARDLLAEDPLIPAELRRGVCVMISGGPVPPGVLGALWRGPLSSEPLLLIGDDPDGEAARSLPTAGVLGPVADPTPYLRASRAVVVLDGPDVAHVLDAAARSHAPAFVLGAGETGPLVEVLGALCEQADLCDAFSPRSAPAPLVADPIPSLAPVRLARAKDAPRRAGDADGPSVIRFVGDMTSLASLAQVNRALAGALSRIAPEFTVTALDPTAPRPTLRSADGVLVASDASLLPAPHVEIRHQWPPDFRPVATGRLVVIQPWEFGGLPAEWVGPVRDVVDELWVPTSWVRDGALASGLDPDWVRVVPNGVDPERFSPTGRRRLALGTNKAVKLLFVGGLIERKGIDVLLEAYLSSFSRTDDVCLVIKPFGSNSVYRNAGLEPAVRRAAAGGGAAIEILDEHLSASDLAALYRACDVLVHPYRGEGFGLPIAEAMSCGLPVIVPDGGAALDYCDASCGWLVDARPVPIDLGELTPSSGGSWWLEPSRPALIEALRHAVRDPEERRRRGMAARERIGELTWTRAAHVARERLRALLGLPSLEPELAGGPR